MYTRIKLIVTGDMEKGGLCDSLKKHFPTLRNNQTVIWDTPRRVDCVTTHRLVLGKQPSKPMVELAKAMLSEVVLGKKGKGADLVVVIDDVEIGNLGQEDVVVQHLKNAITSVLAKYSQSVQNRYRILLQQNCSFYLFKPMVEAYLFGDRCALTISGVPNTCFPKLIHPTDVEQFETSNQNDKVWLDICQEENQKKQQYQWHHEYHAKHYLEYLTNSNQKVFYDETTCGKQALQKLNWCNVPKCGTDMPIIYSLFEDLADWFGVSNPLGKRNLSTHFYPARTVNASTLLLRNL